jgi:hypothetical protein
VPKPLSVRGLAVGLFYPLDLLDENKAIYNNYRVTAIEKVNEYKEVVKQLIETDNRSEEEIKVLLQMHKSQFGD